MKQNFFFSHAHARLILQVNRFCSVFFLTTSCFFAAFLITGININNYFNLYLSVRFPSGETVSAAVITVCVAITSIIAAAVVFLKPHIKHFSVANAVLILFTMIYFLVFLKDLWFLWVLLIIAAVYVSAAIVFAVFKGAAKNTDGAEPQ